MSPEFASIWLQFLAISFASAIAIEAGFRYGRMRKNRAPDEKEATAGSIVGYILALFGLILAFTVSSAAARFEARRQALVEEANTIGTTYLRARLLPEPHGSKSARLLREYVDVRIRGVQERKIAETIARSEEMHGQLWAEATRAAKAKPDPITGLYMNSLNQLIDIHAIRVHVGLRSQIPTSVSFGIFALGILSMASVGYLTGITTGRRTPALVGLILAYAGVMFLIADLSQPYEGTFVHSQQAMLDLQNSMKADL